MDSKLLNTQFKNVNDIDEFFKKYNSGGFIDFFNGHIGKGVFNINDGEHALNKVTNKANFTKVWNNIDVLFDRSSINLVEFLCLHTIICTETALNPYKLSAEIVGNSGNPGISYAFNKVGPKASYNQNSSLGNLTAKKLFNDSDYKSTHGVKPYGTQLKDTTDSNWDGTNYPSGFSTDKDGSNNGFIFEADFMKFRGRGLIQTTGRSNYKNLIEFILKYNGTNQTILSFKNKWSKIGSVNKIATVSTNSDWDTLFGQTDYIIAAEAIHLHNKGAGNYLTIDAEASENSLDASIKKVAKRVNGGAKYIQAFYERVKAMITDILLDKKDDNNNNPPTDDNNGNDGSGNDDNGNGSSDEFNNSNPNEGDNVALAGITNYFRADKDIVTPEKINLSGMSESKKKELASNLGYIPFIWYNGIQLEPQNVSHFVLSNSELLPSVRFTFFDELNILKNTGFPLDDTTFKVLINSRSKLRSIYMEFKLTKFERKAENIYTITGVTNINDMFLRKFVAYQDMSSFDVLKDFASKAKIGFNSNVSGSNDKMNWINPNFSGQDFLKTVINSAYISDHSFIWCYVDLYYNLNYIDVEQALNQDISNLSGISEVGSSSVQDTPHTSSDPVRKLWLTNDPVMTESNMFFSEYKLINQSTDISLRNGYLTDISSYDVNDLELLQFTIDSLTSDGNNSIILKGKPQDENFYKEHTISTYIGKIDKDNMHLNYNYAIEHNYQNIRDIQKIGIRITLPTPNYNLYRYQKIPLILSEDDTPTSTTFNTRLNGEWLIIDIKYILSSGKLKQEVTLIKRELEVDKYPSK